MDKQTNKRKTQKQNEGTIRKETEKGRKEKQIK